ncbi:Tryptamine 5-hydroxylase [Linum perenne]
MDFLSLSIILFLFLTTTFIFLAKIPPPSPPPPPSPHRRLPLIGHLHLLLLSNDLPHVQLARLAAQLGSPIIRLQLGRVNTVVISSAQLARHVLKVNDHVFANRPQLEAARYLSFGCSDVTFSPYGPYWRHVRKICVSELLSHRRVHSFEQVNGYVRREEVDRMVAVIARNSGKETDVTRLVFTLANDVLCRVAFGKRFIEDKKNKKKKELVEVLTETQNLFAGFCLGDFFPGWEWVMDTVTGYRKRLLKNLEDLKEVCDEIIDEHLKKKKEEDHFGDCEKYKDFVDVLLDVQKRDDLDVPITDDNLKALVLDMFVAGTDTSSATIEWTLTELVRHPSCLTKAQSEIRTIVGGKSRVEEGHLQHFTYTKAAIKEAMRLHPPVPLLVPRESMEDCVLEGYKIPAKTRVLVNCYAIGRDPEIWECPLEYRPERFVEEEIDFHDQEFRFVPFGGGRRGCPGFTFGLATIEIALARLLYHFDWSLPDGVGAEDVDLSEVFGLATRKKTALVLVPTMKEGYEHLCTSTS